MRPHVDHLRITLLKPFAVSFKIFYLLPYSFSYSFKDNFVKVICSLFFKMLYLLPYSFPISLSQYPSFIHLPNEIDWYTIRPVLGSWKMQVDNQRLGYLIWSQQADSRSKWKTDLETKMRENNERWFFIMIKIENPSKPQHTDLLDFAMCFIQLPPKLGWARWKISNLSSLSRTVPLCLIDDTPIITFLLPMS